jgi:hypothetical protein
MRDPSSDDNSTVQCLRPAFTPLDGSSLGGQIGANSVSKRSQLHKLHLTVKVNILRATAAFKVVLPWSRASTEVLAKGCHSFLGHLVLKLGATTRTDGDLARQLLLCRFSSAHRTLGASLFLETRKARR